jgi:hypothetical protein
VGTGLGTSRLREAVWALSKGTPDKGDVVFDLYSHNPKIVISNSTCRNQVSR